MPPFFSVSTQATKIRCCWVKGFWKDNWASVFLGICSLCFVTSITKEKQFSAAMINDDTQIVLLGEWSENTLQADLAKTVLQGGYMVTAAKHGETRTIINRCPFYITTNQVPEFDANDVNVKRRIVIFETKPLPKTDMKPWTGFAGML